jgi:microcystin-dependent protein
MANPFVGEIRMFGGNFAPQGWAFCDGSILAISQSEVLFNLIGTTYGGDGQTTFALPDLRGRVPVHQGTSREADTFVIGQRAGDETVTLLAQNVPLHSHPAQAAPGGNVVSPQNAVWSSDPGGNTAAWTTAVAINPPSMAASAIGSNNAGATQPHNNVQPFLAISYIISLFGIFPSQN